MPADVRPPDNIKQCVYRPKTGFSVRFFSGICSALVGIASSITAIAARWPGTASDEPSKVPGVGRPGYYPMPSLRDFGFRGEKRAMDRAQPLTRLAIKCHRSAIPEQRPPA
jgi:hypothetical protein